MRVVRVREYHGWRERLINHFVTGETRFDGEGLSEQPTRFTVAA